jgi:hypothetical protein
MEFGFFDNNIKLQENFIEEINVAIANEDTNMLSTEENEEEFSPTWEQDNYEQWTSFYHFCCYNCKSKMDKIEGYNGTTWQCKWCDLHNTDMMDGSDTLVECEHCEKIAPD